MVLDSLLALEFEINFIMLGAFFYMTELILGDSNHLRSTDNHPTLKHASGNASINSTYLKFWGKTLAKLEVIIHVDEIIGYTGFLV